jgi:hypothetical protein
MPQKESFFGGRNMFLLLLKQQQGELTLLGRRQRSAPDVYPIDTWDQLSTAAAAAATCKRFLAGKMDELNCF